MDDTRPLAFLAEAPELLARHGALAGLPEGAAAWVMAHALDGPAWIVMDEPEAAERLARALAFHARPGQRVLRYPADELPPYCGIAPHPRRLARRLTALDALDRGEPALVVAPVAALAAVVIEPEMLQARVLALAEGAVLPREELRSRLHDLGYVVAVLVEDPGTFAVRGEVVDIWPAGAAAPVRLSFFDDEVESLHHFDADTQRTGDLLGELRLLPTREVLADSAAVQRLALHTRARVEGDRDAMALRRRVMDTLRNKLSFGGVEDWLPALHPTCSPLEHGPGARLVVFDPDAVAERLRAFGAEVCARFEELGPEERPLVGPEERYTPPEALLERLRPAWRLLSLAVEEGGRTVPTVQVAGNQHMQVNRGNLGPVARQLEVWLEEGWRVGLVASGSTAAERARALLEPHGLRIDDLAGRDSARLPPGRLALLTGDLPAGFHAPADRLALLPLDELFGRSTAEPRRRRHHAFQAGQSVGMGRVREGDLLVHAWHGIGRFLGMARPDLGPSTTDFLLLEYRGGDRLYLPVHKLDQLSRYRPASEDAEPRLDKLGGATWQKRRGRVRDAMLRTAHDLLKLYAKRSVITRPPHEERPDWIGRFEAAFPFEETPDQRQAIADVEADLVAEEPMDRLLVGDVGFGKTEVAMRATARVVAGGRQVAVLCPTTVLAYQHLETWRERFFGFPVGIAMLSRFTTPGEAKAIAAALAAGELDLVIGTTRILGRGVRFADLGLLVVDEEHRFGVKQKERVKRMRAEVDVLSMSATPIPRTLSMALSGVRKFSTIATAPAERLSVATRIARFDDDVIREEILKELQRGGQVFFVHDRVRSIAAMARLVQQLVPEARVEVTHGQLPSTELEAALVRFVRRQAEVLVTSTIIESGVDLPNVNCVIVNRADRLGLAQLYQIRGRVGRSYRRGRCVLMVPAEVGVSRKATRRLRVLLEHQDLGAGFAVAGADLEQRGAGTVLGDSQHGHVDAVGFETYVEMLEDVLAEARGELHRKRLDPEVEVPVPAFIPESLVEGMEERLTEYRRLAAAESPAQLRSLLDGLEERTGELPTEVLNLGWLMETRLRCRDLGIARLSWLKVRAELQLDPGTVLLTAKLEALAARLPNRITIPEPDRLIVRFSDEEAEYPFRFLHWLLELLKGEAT